MCSKEQGFYQSNAKCGEGLIPLIDLDITLYPYCLLPEDTTHILQNGFIPSAWKLENGNYFMWYYLALKYFDKEKKDETNN